MRTKIETSMRMYSFLFVFMAIMSMILSLGINSVNKIDKNPPVRIHQIVEIIKY
jgi:hypothetical protein